ncbi:unnamed protein product [Arctogadus glacialis]
MGVPDDGGSQPDRSKPLPQAFYMEPLQLPSSLPLLPHSQPLSGTLQHPAGVPLLLIPLIVSGVAWRVVDESVRRLAESRSEVYRWRIHSSGNYNARPSACCVAGRRLSGKDFGEHDVGDAARGDSKRTKRCGNALRCTAHVRLGTGVRGPPYEREAPPTGRGGQGEGPSL